MKMVVVHFRPRARRDMRNFRIAVASLKREDTSLNLLQKITMDGRVEAAHGSLDARD